MIVRFNGKYQLARSLPLVRIAAPNIYYILCIIRDRFECAGAYKVFVDTMINRDRWMGGRKELGGTSVSDGPVER